MGIVPVFDGCPVTLPSLSAKCVANGVIADCRGQAPSAYGRSVIVAITVICRTDPDAPCHKRFSATCHRSVSRRASGAGPLFSSF